MIQRILAVAAGFLVVLMLGGWGHEVHPLGPQQVGAARAIRALTADAPNAVSALPADFPAVMGYRPALIRRAQQAEPTRADGGCSSPFGGTTYHFSGACKQHDLGYDLLRYANRKGQPLGPWARKAVDDSFARHVLGRCHRFGCGATGELYVAVVRFNSWRQGYAAPVREPLTAFAVPIGGGLLAAGLLGAAPIRSRRSGSGPGSGRARRLGSRLVQRTGLWFPLKGGLA